ncbi:Ig-like domain-containing protein, partial [Rhodococcus spelaei]|uniref:Ig-like domain-containing protein n=1 Tax=Rhodococcus spelaei TaxID=2546320 RepID=UPI0015EFAE11
RNGAHAITAVYSGDAGNKPSTSAAANVQVTTDPVIVDTTTTLNVPATAKTGTAVDLTATVAPAGATGTVQFKDGTNNIGAAAPVNNGTATLNYTFSTNGAHAITAVYSGDAGNKPSTSAAANVQVTTDPVIVDTTTTLNVPGEATTGEAVDLWALVTGPDNAPAVGGTVQFKDGTTNIGGAIALDNNGGAKLVQNFTSAGTHSISAVYTGADGFNASTGAAKTVTVKDPTPVEVNTVTTLNAPATATKGDPVNLTATVKTQSGDPVTTGTVRFMDGTTPIGEAVNVVNGQAALPHAFGQTGARQITAVYTGSTGFKESTSAASTVTVSAATTGPGGGSLSNLFGS